MPNFNTEYPKGITKNKLYIVHCKSTLNRIATIGFFDGVHKGHCFLFERLQHEAVERGLEPLIFTFDVHPRAVLQSDYVPQLLTSPEERKTLLSRFGEVVVLPFKDVQSLTAAQFMQILKEHYSVSVLLMGYDHRFGSDRLRAPEEYQQIGASVGIDVLTLPEFVDGAQHVSSTEIRQALEKGDIMVANELLGRPYTLCGIVEHGKGIGRTIGFPTANIAISDPHKALPKNGVYAVQIQVEEGEMLPAVLNIGTNPTVGNKNLSLEVHIPDFEQDIYGKNVTVYVLRYLREEQRFDSLTALREQIIRDIDSSLRPV